MSWLGFCGFPEVPFGSVGVEMRLRHDIPSTHPVTLMSYDTRYYVYNDKIIWNWFRQYSYHCNVWIGSNTCNCKIQLRKSVGLGAYRPVLHTLYLSPVVRDLYPLFLSYICCASKLVFREYYWVWTKIVIMCRNFFLFMSRILIRIF